MSSIENLRERTLNFSWIKIVFEHLGLAIANTIDVLSRSFATQRSLILGAPYHKPTSVGSSDQL